MARTSEVWSSIDSLGQIQWTLQRHDGQQVCLTVEEAWNDREFQSMMTIELFRDFSDTQHPVSSPTQTSSPSSISAPAVGQTPAQAGTPAPPTPAPSTPATTHTPASSTPQPAFGMFESQAPWLKPNLFNRGIAHARSLPILRSSPSHMVPCTPPQYQPAPDHCPQRIVRSRATLFSSIPTEDPPSPSPLYFDGERVVKKRKTGR